MTILSAVHFLFSCWLYPDGRREGWMPLVLVYRIAKLVSRRLTGLLRQPVQQASTYG